MQGLTMCYTKKCKKRYTCLRYMKEPHTKQYYSDYTSKKCEMYVKCEVRVVKRRTCSLVADLLIDACGGGK